VADEDAPDLGETPQAPRRCRRRAPFVRHEPI
jgi:hypothetical protein